MKERKEADETAFLVAQATWTIISEQNQAQLAQRWIDQIKQTHGVELTQEYFGKTQPDLHFQSQKRLRLHQQLEDTIRANWHVGPYDILPHEYYHRPLSREVLQLLVKASRLVTLVSARQRLIDIIQTRLDTSDSVIKRIMKRDVKKLIEKNPVETPTKSTTSEDAMAQARTTPEDVLAQAPTTSEDALAQAPTTSSEAIQSTAAPKTPYRNKRPNPNPNAAYRPHKPRRNDFVSKLRPTMQMMRTGSDRMICSSLAMRILV